jgi:long-chain acyl-CoA synthetase
VERVKALVVARPGLEAGRALEEELIQWCRERLIKWSCPREVEFRASLPLTLVGKVDVRKIREEQASPAGARDPSAPGPARAPEPLPVTLP